MQNKRLCNYSKIRILHMAIGALETVSKAQEVSPEYVFGYFLWRFIYIYLQQFWIIILQKNFGSKEYFRGIF